MRPILLADLDMAARVLLARTPLDRRATMEEMILEAERADRTRTVTGRPQAGGGDGSLLAEALLRQPAGASVAGPLYRDCLALVLVTLAEFETDIMRCSAPCPGYMMAAERGAARELRNPGGKDGRRETFDC